MYNSFLLSALRFVVFPNYLTCQIVGMSGFAKGVANEKLLPPFIMVEANISLTTLYTKGYDLILFIKPSAES